jgi:hypothetical protein
MQPLQQIRLKGVMPMGQAMGQATMEPDRKTAPEMAPRAPNKKQEITGGRALHALSAVVLALIMFLSTPVRADGGNMVLENSGIMYPEGFDLNTVGEVSGNVRNLTMPETGPVSFGLAAEKDTYTVLASPSWYWRQTGLSITEGEQVTVRGSKSLGKDSRLYIIAQDIKSEGTGKMITLRGKDGRPLWSGASHMPGPGNRGSAIQRGTGKGTVSGGHQKRGK